MQGFWWILWVTAVPTRDVLLCGGNTHCITQQEPAQHVQG